jgi:NADPH:quinone reductase-like Zn-dependent oxidoreductase
MGVKSNRVVQVRRFGVPDGLEVVNAPLPTAGLGEVRVRVLASGLDYTDMLIRRRLYPQQCVTGRPSLWAMRSSLRSISSAPA